LNDEGDPCPWLSGHVEGNEQGALFEIEGPDEDGCVWLHAGATTVNLGPRDRVAERLQEWLANVEHPEPEPSTDRDAFRG
jgi:hypothetical protein